MYGVERDLEHVEEITDACCNIFTIEFYGV